MLELIDIKKDYPLDKTRSVHALQGISLSFGESGLVAILGPSGCGKTTLLNIISGLDRYTSGDLVVDGVSTKRYKDRDWDDYRNKKVGMVFQSYNLISHLNIFENASIPLTLADEPKKEIRKKTEEALAAVGLADQASKHPNQLSGGQQQRVAIARAIINNPSIVLADEPTGALDSKTSVQVMDILSSLSKTKLVIMVTHNRELALSYADRIVSMKDGIVESDKPNEKKVKESTTGIADEKMLETLTTKIPVAKAEHVKKARMSFWTAFKMSFQNMMTKKGRTTITAIASSFGIIGVGLVLAVSNGFSSYVSRQETESLSKFPISIEQYGISTDTVDEESEDDTLPEYPDTDTVYIQKPSSYALHVNKLTDEYLDYVNDMDSSLYSSIKASYSVNANVITESFANGDSDPTYETIDTTPLSVLEDLTGSNSYWTQLPGDEDFIMSQYDLVDGSYPTEANQLLLVVDKYNSISQSTLEALGFNPDPDTGEYEGYKELTLEDLKDHDYKLISNDDYYTTDSSQANNTVLGLGLRNDKTYADYLDVEAEYSNLYANGDTPTDEEQMQVFEDFMSLFADITIPSAIQDDPSSFLTALALWYAANPLPSAESEYESYLEDFTAFLAGEGIDFSNYNFVDHLDTFVAPSSGTDRIEQLYDDSDTTLNIVGIVRPKSTTSLGILGDGVYYTSGLTDKVLADAKDSKIAGQANDYMMLDLATIADDFSSIADSSDLASLATGLLKFYSMFDANQTITADTYLSQRQKVGSEVGISSITVYPKDFDSKSEILAYLDAYNEGKEDSEKVVYTDIAGMFISSVGTMVNMISLVLIIFASISLVVSSVMIGIIIYVSVIERTKEIGTLRSVGARKKDVGRLFIMESVAIGLLAGVLGVVTTYIVSIPINIIVDHVYADYDIGSIAFLNPVAAIILISISALLTFIAGLIPSRIAAHQDPVKCLRSE